MSLKQAIKALENLGLTEMDARVYIYLAKKGPHTDQTLANALKLTTIQISFSVKKLVIKRMVSTSSQRSTLYLAIGLEKVIDQFLKDNKKQAKALQQNREELLSIWNSMTEFESVGN